MARTISAARAYRPKIEHERDTIIKSHACAICSSDLHLFDGVNALDEKGDVLGHETMGEVVEVGSENKKLKSAIASWFHLQSLAENASSAKKGFFSAASAQIPITRWPKKLWATPRGPLCYSHMLGGYAGGQAEYLRVPYADVGPIKVPQVSATKQSFPVRYLPHGFHAADFCNLKGEKPSLSGAVPCRPFAIKSAFLLAPNESSPSTLFRNASP